MVVSVSPNPILDRILRNEDRGCEARKSLRPERNQNVDHPWIHCPRRSGLGENGDDIHGFLVESGTPGFQTTLIQRKFLIELLHFSSYPQRLYHSRRKPPPWSKRLEISLKLPELRPLRVACSALGSAVACYEVAGAFALKREVFEKPIASYQLVQEKLVQMVLEITKAQLLTYHLGRLLDQHKARPPQISMVKLNNVREAMKIARTPGISSGPGNSGRSPRYSPSL